MADQKVSDLLQFPRPLVDADLSVGQQNDDATDTFKIPMSFVKDFIGNPSPLTTKGDLYTHDGTKADRLGIGTEGEVLTVQGGDLSWQPASGGGGSPGGTVEGAVQLRNSDGSGFNAFDNLTFDGTVVTLTGVMSAARDPATGSAGVFQAAVSDVLTNPTLRVANRLGITNLGVYHDGSAVFGQATGGNQGAGTINAKGVYKDGTEYEPGLGNPAQDGQVLSSTATGVRSWITPSGGGGTPGGDNTQVQFNDSGSFGGSPNLTFSGDVLTVGANGNPGIILNPLEELNKSKLTLVNQTTENVELWGDGYGNLRLMAEQHGAGTPGFIFAMGRTSPYRYCSFGPSTGTDAMIVASNQSFGLHQNKFQYMAGASGGFIVGIHQTNTALGYFTVINDMNQKPGMVIQSNLGGAMTYPHFQMRANGGSSQFEIWGEDGSTLVGNPTGGRQGAGTINAKGFYIDGTPLTGSAAALHVQQSSSARAVAVIQTTDDSTAHNVLEIHNATGDVLHSFGSTGSVVFSQLPTSDPAVAGALWNNAGVVNISAG